MTSPLSISTLQQTLGEHSANGCSPFEFSILEIVSVFQPSTGTSSSLQCYFEATEDLIFYTGTT